MESEGDDVVALQMPVRSETGIARSGLAGQPFPGQAVNSAGNGSFTSVFDHHHASAHLRSYGSCLVFGAGCFQDKCGADVSLHKRSDTHV